ncbi:hypothetical protein [Desulfovibrio sp.]|uniref:hypothetical protein n=1 Tax=Desulfovibrio sp. TaxID=885 RepID=UPI0025C2713B|nr:hypothetical protein [Desulfovibrio sp.]
MAPRAVSITGLSSVPFHYRLDGYPHLWTYEPVRGCTLFLSTRSGRRNFAFCPFFAPLQPASQKKFEKIKKISDSLVIYFFNWYGVPIRMNWYPRLPFVSFREKIHNYD